MLIVLKIVDHYYLDYKKKWKFYYAFFTFYILNKKVTNRILENFAGDNVNENNIEKDKNILIFII